MILQRSALNSATRSSFVQEVRDLFCRERERERQTDGRADRQTDREIDTETTDAER